MGWGDNDPIAAKWSRILREKFMDEGQSSNGKYYIDLSRVKPRFDLEAYLGSGVSAVRSSLRIC